MRWATSLLRAGLRRGYVQYVHVVHEAFDCFGSGGWERLRPLIADDNVMTSLETWPDPGPYVGPDASIREYQRLFELFRGIEVSVGNIVSHESWVIAHYRGVIEGDQRAVPTELRFTGVDRFAGDRFAESRYRLDRDAALSAAGLLGKKKPPAVEGGATTGGDALANITGGHKDRHRIKASAGLAVECGVSHRGEVSRPVANV